MFFFQTTHVSQHAPSHLSNVSFRRTCHLDCAVAADTLLSSLLLQHFYKIFFLFFFFFYFPCIPPKCKSEPRAKVSPLGHVEVSCSVSRAADFLLQSWRPQTRWRRTARGPSESRQSRAGGPSCREHTSLHQSFILDVLAAATSYQEHLEGSFTLLSPPPSSVLLLFWGFSNEKAQVAVVSSDWAESTRPRCNEAERMK